MNEPFEKWWAKIHEHCGPAPHPNEVFSTLKIGVENAFNAGREYERSQLTPYSLSNKQVDSLTPKPFPQE